MTFTSPIGKLFCYFERGGAHVSWQISPTSIHLHKTSRAPPYSCRSSSPGASEALLFVHPHIHLHCATQKPSSPALRCAVVYPSPSYPCRLHPVLLSPAHPSPPFFSPLVGRSPRPARWTRAQFVVLDTQMLGSVLFVSFGLGFIWLFFGFVLYRIVTHILDNVSNRHGNSKCQSFVLRWSMSVS